jgi:hypothetical protein
MFAAMIKGATRAWQRVKIERDENSQSFPPLVAFLKEIFAFLSFPCCIPKSIERYSARRRQSDGPRFSLLPRTDGFERV